MISSSRQAFRRPLQNLGRRQASNTSGSQKASEAAAKASEAASRAGKAASEAAGKAADLASQYAGGLGARLSNLLGAYREPVVYNGQVLLHILKNVYRAERLAPPSSLAEIQTAYSTLWHRAKDLGYWRQLRANGQWKTVAIGGLELYGIFKIGEIIGRRSLVGYKLD